MSSLKHTREHILPRHFHRNKRGGHLHDCSLGQLNLVPVCEPCNNGDAITGKGSLSFLPYIEKLSASHTPQQKQKTLENCGRYFESKFDELLTNHAGNHQKAMRKLIGKIGNMAVIGENNETFPPTPEQIERLYRHLIEAKSFTKLFNDQRFQDEMALYKKDAVVGGIAVSLLASINRLRVVA